MVMANVAAAIWFDRARCVKTALSRNTVVGRLRSVFGKLKVDSAESKCNCGRRMCGT